MLKHNSLAKSFETKNWKVVIEKHGPHYTFNPTQAAKSRKEGGEAINILFKTMATHSDKPQLTKRLGVVIDDIRRAIPGKKYTNEDYWVTFKVIVTHKKTKRVSSTVVESASQITTTIQALCEGLRSEIANYRRSERQFIPTHGRIRFNGNSRPIVRYGGLAALVDLERILEQERSLEVFKPKKPKTNENHVGVEIEFVCPLDKTELAKRLRQASLASHVELKSDGSISTMGNGIGHELAVIMPESKRVEILDRVCAVLKGAGAKVNKTCGLHVHLDMRFRNREKSFFNLVKAQPVLYGMNPKSRQESRYCKKTKTVDIATESANRYKGVNASSLRKFGTIEVRIHSGTCDYVKITNWIDILISVVDSTPEIVRSPRTLKSFSKQFGVNDRLIAYIESRLRLFSETGEISDDADEVAAS
jgi:Putative amidoligase enzyme